MLFPPPLSWQRALASHFHPLPLPPPMPSAPAPPPLPPPLLVGRDARRHSHSPPPTRALTRAQPPFLRCAFLGHRRALQMLSPLRTVLCWEENPEVLPRMLSSLLSRCLVSLGGARQRGMPLNVQERCPHLSPRSSALAVPSLGAVMTNPLLTSCTGSCVNVSLHCSGVCSRVDLLGSGRCVFGTARTGLASLSGRVAFPSPRCPSGPDCVYLLSTRCASLCLVSHADPCVLVTPGVECASLQRAVLWPLVLRVFHLQILFRERAVRVFPCFLFGSFICTAGF